MYAIIQKGYSVFGTGKTEEEAVIDCREWLDSDDKHQTWDVRDFPSYDSANDGDFCIVNMDEMTEEEQELYK